MILKLGLLYLFRHLYGKRTGRQRHIHLHRRTPSRLPPDSVRQNLYLLSHQSLLGHKRERLMPQPDTNFSRRYHPGNFI